MKAFSNILFWAAESNGSQAVLDRAVTLAARSQAKLTIADVMKGPPRDMLMLVPAISAEALQESAFEESCGRLQELIAPLKGRGAEVDTRLLFGGPWVELAREVRERSYDLLIVYAPAEAKLRKRLCGGAVSRLMRKAVCPVWAIKRVVPESGAILAAVNPEDKEISKKVLDFASAMARLAGHRLHIVHVWNLVGERILRNRARLQTYEIAELLRDAHYLAKTSLEELVSHVDLRGIEYRLELAKGEPSRMIAEVARRKGADLVVMGQCGRTRLAALLAGNCVDDVFEAVEGSIITVPAGSAKASLTQWAA